MDGGELFINGCGFSNLPRLFRGGGKNAGKDGPLGLCGNDCEAESQARVFGVADIFMCACVYCVLTQHLMHSRGVRDNCFTVLHFAHEQSRTLTGLRALATT